MNPIKQGVCRTLTFANITSHSAFTLWCHVVFDSRREQSLDKKYPGLFKHHSSRQSSSSNSMDKLIKKRNVPQKLPSGKRYEFSFESLFHKRLMLKTWINEYSSGLWIAVVY